jgi:Mg/Co/Ni transporter MgtE
MNTLPTDTALLDAVIDRFFADHPRVAAQKLERIDRDHAVEILMRLPIEQLVIVWESLSQESSADILQRLPDEKCTQLAARADTGKLAVVLSRLAEEDRETILKRLDREQAAELRTVLAYPADRVAGLMRRGVWF